MVNEGVGIRLSQCVARSVCVPATVNRVCVALVTERTTPKEVEHMTVIAFFSQGQGP